MPIPEQCRAPAYPALALRRGLAGRVVCLLTVAADGRVTEVSIEHSSGHALLDEAAREALSRWRFRPARRDGRAVETVVRKGLLFRLP